MNTIANYTEQRHILNLIIQSHALPLLRDKDIQAQLSHLTIRIAHLCTITRPYNALLFRGFAEDFIKHRLETFLSKNISHKADILSYLQKFKA